MRCRAPRRASVPLGLLAALLPACAGAPPPGAVGFDWLVGRGVGDVTGPVVGVRMFGYVRPDQIAAGLHLRLRSRAFVIAEPDGGRRVAFASVELGSVTHALQLEVVERLAARFGDLYRIDNTILSATHTHAGPGGYWHWGADTVLGGPFYREHFDLVARGIVESIAAAHEDLEPGALLLATGSLEGAGAQRSRAAYLANPPQERARHGADTPREMTLLKLVDASGPIGVIDWFAVHPTAMGPRNRLVSGDHKGYASQRFERLHAGRGLVAAFAQSDCGDVTPNLNLDGTGPGGDDFETTRIIGERQLAAALELFARARERLRGRIDVRHAYVDFSAVTVGAAFTGVGPRTTCPSAYGYAFAAGSTEDGGGHPLFREGMTRRNPLIDAVARRVAPLPPPGAGLRACHAPKPILFAPGAADPPAQSQVLPLSIVRIGRLVLIAGPAEFTTMAGRRIRETVAAALGEPAAHLVIAGHANGYAGYVTTGEEYATQQYEGGHTLFGPWTLAAYRQEYARLARALAAGTAVERGPRPPDPRGEVASTPLATGPDAPPPGARFGAPVRRPQPAYRRGERVMVSFWSGNPRGAAAAARNYLEVQRREAGGWRTVATDADWETRCRWRQPGREADAYRVEIAWHVPAEAPPGTYRIVHLGTVAGAGGARRALRAASPAFRVE